jgi:hypothetical protein
MSPNLKGAQKRVNEFILVVIAFLALVAGVHGQLSVVHWSRDTAPSMDD